MCILTGRHLQKSFGQGSAATPVLTDANVDIHEGESVVILGPSGSGKSTLLNILGLIEPMDSGEIMVLQKSISQLSSAEKTDFRRHHLGFIFQQFNLVPVMSVFSNVAYPLFLLGWSSTRVQHRVMEILEQVGLEEHAGKKPEQLSGGQCQRVAIARALVKRPAVIIADEPTASLDAETATNVMQLMKALSHEQGTACVIATHDMRLLPYSDTVLEVDNGQVRSVTSANAPLTPVTQEGVML